MTVEQVLRRIESECREDIAALKGYAPRWRQDGTGPIMKGAQGEGRGITDKCREIRVLCRKLRREHRSDTARINAGERNAMNKEPQFKCTVCGQIGTVGRCCGDETRIPLNDEARAIYRQALIPRWEAAFEAFREVAKASASAKLPDIYFYRFAQIWNDFEAILEQLKGTE